ncbi:MAG: dihydroorotate dehydrogenase, partial [Ruminococcaceae bacterium]|nr:dihydroorotate dehydrogenase [Oscillospiraceae bacterium]
MANTSIELCGLSLNNPVIPASGCFGYGHEFASIFDINCLGSIALKGTTPEARFGNELPRIAECHAGLLNAIGLQNPGVEAVINEELPKLNACYNKKVIANISGFSVSDYVYAAQRLSAQEQVGIVEVNISCPNVHAG